jgi:putative flavoprotein involved in K+ transport
MTDTTHVETIVIGAGQAGLATGYHLARRRPSVPDPGCARPGRGRLAEPVRLAAALQPGQVRRPARWGFPAEGWSWPTKDEVADYLEAYAAGSSLPVRTGTAVDSLSRTGTASS